MAVPALTGLSGRGFWLSTKPAWLGLGASLPSVRVQLTWLLDAAMIWLHWSAPFVLLRSGIVTWSQYWTVTFVRGFTSVPAGGSCSFTMLRRLKDVADSGAASRTHGIN